MDDVKEVKPIKLANRQPVSDKFELVDAKID